MKAETKWRIWLFCMAAIIGIGIADLWVNLPDQWAEFYNFWIMGGGRP